MTWSTKWAVRIRYVLKDRRWNAPICLYSPIHESFSDTSLCLFTKLDTISIITYMIVFLNKILLKYKLKIFKICIQEFSQLSSLMRLIWLVRRLLKVRLLSQQRLVKSKNNVKNAGASNSPRRIFGFSLIVKSDSSHKTNFGLPEIS